MDFDHARGQKVADISRLAVRGATKQLREELVKCDVVCANCHRIRTFNRSRPGSEMDIIGVYETSVAGSTPALGTTEPASGSYPSK